MYALSRALRRTHHNPCNIPHPWPRFHATTSAPGSPSDIVHTLRRHPKDLPPSARGAPGRNLSQRYASLERALRKKHALVAQQVETEEAVVVHDPEAVSASELSTEAPSHAAVGTMSTSPSSSSTIETFRGFVIPEKPKPPADDGAYLSYGILYSHVELRLSPGAECCMSGCAICVYDLYEDSLQSYEDSISTVRSNLQAIGVPEGEWPVSIRPGGSAGTNSEGASSRSGELERKSQVLSAFEELERSLKAKHAN